MEKATLEEFKEDVDLLIQGGFLAVKQLDEKSARQLFETAQMLDPENDNPQIGLGFIHLNKLEVKQATSIFTEVVKKFPEDQLGRVYLGMCYTLVESKREEGEELIRDAMDKAEDETVVNLGKNALEYSKELEKRKISIEK